MKSILLKLADKKLWEVVKLHSKKKIQLILILANNNKWTWDHCTWTSVTVGSFANFKVSILSFFFFFLQKISTDKRKLRLLLCPCKYSVVFALFRQKIRLITTGNDPSVMIIRGKLSWPVILKCEILW